MTSGRIHGKRRRSMASRTSAPAATVSEGLGTKSIYYRRATISCSQGASALPFDDASVVNPPSAFGTFRVLHQIGSGVLGPVFRSYDSQRERLVVIKAFKLDLAAGTGAGVADALRGIVARPVDDSGVVRAVDAGLEGATPFLALEFVSDDTLDAMLRESRPVTRTQAARTLSRSSVARLMRRGNSASVTARCIPRDVFVGGDSGEVAITGFGVAQALQAVGLQAPGAAPVLGAGARRRRRLGSPRRRLLARARSPRSCLGRAAPHPLTSARCWNRRWPTSRRRGFGTAARVRRGAGRRRRRDAQLPSSAAAVRERIDAASRLWTSGAGETHRSDPRLSLCARRCWRPRRRRIEIEDAPVDRTCAMAPSSAPSLCAPAVSVDGAAARRALACLAAGGLVGFQVGFSAWRRCAHRERACQCHGSASALRRGHTPAPVAASPREGPDAPSIAAPPPQAAPSGPQPGRRRSPTAAAGSLEVDSRPRGARVTVDGRPVGQTPLKVPAVSPGDHRVLIELTGTPARDVDGEGRCRRTDEAGGVAGADER